MGNSLLAVRGINHKYIVVGSGDWEEYKTPIEIIKYTGFDAYMDRNEPFIQAENYFKNRDFKNEHIENMINVVIPVYRKHLEDITQGAVLYYSPKAQKRSHAKNPGKYGENPSWDFEKLIEIRIAGCEAEDFRFFKYK